MLATPRTLLHLTAAAATDRLHHQSVEASADAQPLLQQLEEQGFVVVPDYYPAETCAAMRAEIDRLIREYPRTTLHLPDDDRVMGAERVSELIAQYHDDAQLHALAAAFHQAPILNLFTLANRVRPEPGGLGSGGGWHRDSVHQRQFKTLLYLTDVNEHSGAYQYVSGTHTPGALLDVVRAGHVDFNQNRLNEIEVDDIIEQSQGRFRLHTVTGRAGTLVITDTRGIHRGKPVTEGIRYALTNYFFARHYLTAKSEARFRALFVDRPAEE